MLFLGLGGKKRRRNVEGGDPRAQPWHALGHCSCRPPRRLDRFLPTPPPRPAGFGQILSFLLSFPIRTCHPPATVALDGWRPGPRRQRRQYQRQPSCPTAVVDSPGAGGPGSVIHNVFIFQLVRRSHLLAISASLHLPGLHRRSTMSVVRHARARPASCSRALQRRDIESTGGSCPMCNWKFNMHSSDVTLFPFPCSPDSTSDPLCWG